MVFGASHNLLVVRVVVDDLLGPIVGFIGLVLVVEGDGGLDVVDAAGPALGALELAVGPPWRDSGVSPLLSPPFRAA